MNSGGFRLAARDRQGFRQTLGNLVKRLFAHPYAFTFTTLSRYYAKIVFVSSPKLFCSALLKFDLSPFENTGDALPAPVRRCARDEHPQYR
jgi:hypothetical protein